VITPIIVLIASLVLLYAGIQSVLSLLIGIACYWGNVSFKQPSSISYKFTAGGMGLASLVIGLAGTLWSVTVLAIKFS